jgi:hypothetical protein
MAEIELILVVSACPKQETEARRTNMLKYNLYMFRSAGIKVYVSVGNLYRIDIVCCRTYFVQRIKICETAGVGEKLQPSGIVKMNGIV